MSAWERAAPTCYADRYAPDCERERAGERANRGGDESSAVPFLKPFTVFNSDQCEGLYPCGK